MSTETNQNPEADPMKIVEEHFARSQAAIFSVINDLEEGGRKLVIEHHQLVPAAPREPTRAESPARAHAFNGLGDFTSYLIRYGAAGQIVIAIDLFQAAAAAVLNEAAGDGTETVTYRPIHSREWSEILAILGKPLSPREFSKAVRRLRDAIVEPDKMTVRLLAAGLSTSKGVEEMDSVGTKGVFGHVVKLKAQAGNQAAPLDIPEQFVVRVKPFIDSQEPIDLEVFIDLVPHASGVGFELEAPDAARVFERAMERGREQLVEALGISALVTYGTLRREPWSYLESPEA